MIKDTTIYTYEVDPNGIRENERMTQSDDYKNTVALADINSPTNEKLSTTYYYLDAIGPTQKIFKGDEIADYTHDYKTSRDSYYFYSNTVGAKGVRAQLADVDMQMSRSAISRSAAFDETNLRSETFYNLNGIRAKREPGMRITMNPTAR